MDRPVDEDLGFPGNREIIEAALLTSVTQVLYLSPESVSTQPSKQPFGRSLLERGSSAVRGMERIPADERFWSPEVAPELSVLAAASRDGVPADIAEAYIRAKTEVKAILAEYSGQEAERPLSPELGRAGA